MKNLFAMLLLSSRFHRFSSLAPKKITIRKVRPVTTFLSASKDVTDTKPLIIGGGISGLATAAALENIAGISSQILEKQTLEGFQDTKKGAGAQIGPNGLRALKAIGGDDLMQQCIDSGSILKGNAMILPGMSDPMILPDTTEDDTGLPQVFIRWGVLRELLANQITKSSIDAGFDEDVRGYKVNEDGTIVLIADQDSDVEHGEANLIVSAEGARSLFRHLIHADCEIIGKDEDKESSIDSRLKDTGRINLKAVVPRNLGDSFLSGHTYAWFAQDGGVGCFAGPAGSGYTYWAISISDSIDETTGKTTPFSEGVDQNDFHSIKSALLNKLKGLNSADCQFVIDLVQDTAPETIYASRSVEALDIGPHLQKDDTIVLVGDSAHAMPASYGQSPNFALEDAVVLARCLRDGATVKSALESYSEKRVSRCLEMQQRSAERAAKAMKGEQTEDVSKWIFQWDVN